MKKLVAFCIGVLSIAAIGCEERWNGRRVQELDEEVEEANADGRTVAQRTEGRLERAEDELEAELEQPRFD
jgi:hypothetical protein